MSAAVTWRDSEAVFSRPELECLCSPIENGQDGVSNGLLLDGALRGDPPRVCICLRVDNLVRIAIHDDVGVVRDKYDLTQAL